MEGSTASDFFKAIYSDNAYRIHGKRSLKKDLLKFYKNRFLRFFYEKSLIRQNYDPNASLFFIVATPRSGTTLLHQLLAKVLDVAYITNYMAPYWMAPVHAMHLQGLREDPEGPPLSSSYYGNTEGPKAPHEFGYFWQYWMQHQEHDELEKEEVQKLPWERIGEELLALAGFSRRPLLIKNLKYLDHKVEDLAERFPTARFIHVQREAFPTASSLLNAREGKYGDRSVWWSIRPRGYAALKTCPPEEQVAFQYYHTERSLDRYLGSLEKDRWVSVRYEDLLEAPYREIDRIKEWGGFSQRESVDLENVVRSKKGKEDPNLQKALERFDDLSKEDLDRFQNERMLDPGT